MLFKKNIAEERYQTHSLRFFPIQVMYVTLICIFAGRTIYTIQRRYIHGEKLGTVTYTGKLYLGINRCTSSYLKIPLFLDQQGE